MLDVFMWRMLSICVLDCLLYDFSFASFGDLYIYLQVSFGLFWHCLDYLFYCLFAFVVLMVACLVFTI